MIELNTRSFRYRLNPWVDADGNLFDRDVAVDFGYTHCCYEFLNTKNKKTYLGRTDITRRSNRIKEDFIGYTTSSRNDEFVKDIKKNPQNYIRRIVSLHKSLEESAYHEEMMTTELNEEGIPYWKRDDTYNLIRGGHWGGFSGEDNYMYGRDHTLEAKELISEANKGNQNALGHRKTEEQKRIAGERSRKMHQDNPDLFTKSVVFGFDGNLYEFKSIKDGNKYIDRENVIYKWISEEVTKEDVSYKKVGIEFVRLKTENDTGEFRNPWDYSEMRKHIRENLSEVPASKRACRVIFKTGEIKDFESLAACAKYFNLKSKSQVHNWVVGLHKPHKKYGIESVEYID